MKSENRTCQNCKSKFVIEPEDFNFYEKISVPLPTFCPECRMLRRFLFRNVKSLFRRPDSRTGEEIFSLIPKGAPAKVYALDFWNSDGWDPMEYGHDYDFKRPFFEQFRELLYAVPWPARSAVNPKNSDYSDNFTDAKNSYLCFNGYMIENSAYVVGFNTVREGFDLNEARHAELCYENYMSDESYKVFYSVNCEDCHEVWFSRNLLGCTNCFGCVNLRNKSYHIFNKRYTKEAYAEFMKQFDSGSHKAVRAMREKAETLWRSHPMRFTLAINVSNVTGEHIEHSKNVKQSYNIHESENLGYCQYLEGVKDSYDYTVWGEASRMYECVTCGEQCDNLKWCWECWPSSRDLEYSAFCRSSSELFGCVGLKKKQYCIFNKQYSKGEYESLRRRIIAHMNEMPYTDKKGRVYKYGEFFPVEFSPYAYNETMVQDFFPLDKSEAESKGFLWREPDRREYETTIKATDLPDHIKDASDLVLKEVIECSECKRAYRIIEMELQFLRRIGLPLPRKCPECRFKDRFRFVNPPKLWPGKCHCAGKQGANRKSQIAYTNATKHFHGEDQCPNEFRTSYDPNSPHIVYCESCYNSEVV
ncbi:MAG: hypothetical protein HY435_02210 [Candidatus Liptonbacteria bacterium]|nr:hypothetical protein [Candidatus Liptonbacteria bacterium]